MISVVKGAFKIEGFNMNENCKDPLPFQRAQVDSCGTLVI